MTLGQKLKTLLKDNGMTQEDLAERLEVSRQAVGKWAVSYTHLTLPTNSA